MHEKMLFLANIHVPFVIINSMCAMDSQKNGHLFIFCIVFARSEND